MVKILIRTDNDLLYEDIKTQIFLYEPEYTIINEYHNDDVYDLVIFDEKIEELKVIRKYSYKIPIIYFQGKERITSATLGESDMILKKPFTIDSLLNAIKSSVFIFDSSKEGYIYFNDYEIRPAVKEIINKRNNKVIKLTEKEVDILKYLYKAHKPVTKTELLQNVWGYNSESMTHTIETHIYRLRNKVEDDSFENSEIIITEENGYKLNLDFINFIDK